MLNPAGEGGNDNVMISDRSASHGNKFPRYCPVVPTGRGPSCRDIWEIAWGFIPTHEAGFRGKGPERRGLSSLNCAQKIIMAWSYKDVYKEEGFAPVPYVKPLRGWAALAWGAPWSAKISFSPSMRQDSSPRTRPAQMLINGGLNKPVTPGISIPGDADAGNPSTRCRVGVKHSSIRAGRRKKG